MNLRLSSLKNLFTRGSTSIINVGLAGNFREVTADFQAGQLPLRPGHLVVQASGTAASQTHSIIKATIGTAGEENSLVLQEKPRNQWPGFYPGSAPLEVATTARVFQLETAHQAIIAANVRKILENDLAGTDGLAGSDGHIIETTRALFQQANAPKSTVAFEIALEKDGPDVVFLALQAAHNKQGKELPLLPAAVMAASYYEAVLSADPQRFPRLGAFLPAETRYIAAMNTVMGAFPESGFDREHPGESFVEQLKEAVKILCSSETYIINQAVAQYFTAMRTRYVEAKAVDAAAAQDQAFPMVRNFLGSSYALNLPAKQEATGGLPGVVGLSRRVEVKVGPYNYFGTPQEGGPRNALVNRMPVSPRCWMAFQKALSGQSG